MYTKITKHNRIITEIQRFLLLFSRQYYFLSVTIQHRARAQYQLISVIVSIHSRWDQEVILNPINYQRSSKIKDIWKHIKNLSLTKSTKTEWKQVSLLYQRSRSSTSCKTFCIFQFRMLLILFSWTQAHWLKLPVGKFLNGGRGYWAGE